MKIKYANNKNTKLQALKLYSNFFQINMQTNISYIQTHFNIISNILYKYDITNKKILFLGFPASFKYILKNKNHKIIPDFMLFNGMITNIKSITEVTKEKKIDLIVICNEYNKSTIVKESYKSRIPTISFSISQNFNNKSAYYSIGNYEFFNEKVKNNDFVLFFFKTILMKSKKVKKT